MHEQQPPEAEVGMLVEPDLLQPWEEVQPEARAAWVEARLAAVAPAVRRT